MDPSIQTQRRNYLIIGTVLYVVFFGILTMIIFLKQNQHWDEIEKFIQQLCQFIGYRKSVEHPYGYEYTQAIKRNMTIKDKTFTEI